MPKIDAKELKEFEDYAKVYENTADVYNVPLCLQAATVLLLVEILRALRPDLTKDES